MYIIPNKRKIWASRRWDSRRFRTGNLLWRAGIGADGFSNK
ncbi:hypothetical protein LINPERPRIM_LOCUS23983 [Linum perenne]